MGMFQNLVVKKLGAEYWSQLTKVSAQSLRPIDRQQTLQPYPGSNPYTTGPFVNSNIGRCLGTCPWTTLLHLKL